MKTILENLIYSMPENTYFTTTTVWNYYSNSTWEDLLKNKNSNLHKLIADKTTASDEYLKNGVTIFTGAKGRTAHSETQIILFRGDHSENTQGTFFSFDELVKLGVR